MRFQTRQCVQALAAMAAMAGACAGQGVIPPPPAQGWKFTVGLGIISQPEYPGSSYHFAIKGDLISRFAPPAASRLPDYSPTP
jgi:hypothetical protein